MTGATLGKARNDAYVACPRGYILSDPRHVEQLLAVEVELLRSEGIDPEWPGFPEPVTSDKARDE